MSLHKLLESQREEQGALEAQAQTTLRALQRLALQDLEARLKLARGQHDESAFTVQLLSSLREQLRALLRDLEGRMEGELHQLSAQAHGQGGRHLLDQVLKQEGGISLGVRNRLGLALQTSARLRRPASLRLYGELLVSRLEQELAIALLSQVSRYEAVGRLMERSAQHMQMSEWRAALIYRNELSSAYDDAAKLMNEGLSGELYAVKGEHLLTRMDEARDRRSHPFSLAAHGTTAIAGQPWRVAVSEVNRWAAVRGSRAGGIVWPIVDGAYEGMGYIAHHNDRGRRTAWRAGWGDPKGG